MDLRNTTTLGLDLGSTGFRAVELSWRGDRPVVQRWAAAEYETGVDDWDKANAIEMSGALADLVAERDIRSALVAHSVSGKSVVPQYFNFPQLMDEDIAEAVRIEVESGLPFRVEDTLFTYILFPDLRTTPGKSRTHGLAIAADGAFVENRLDIIRNAGLAPFCVETDATACANAFLATRKEAPEGAAVAILNVGHRYTNLVVLGGENTLLMRDMPWAGARLTQGIADALSVSAEEAARLKRLHWDRGPQYAEDLNQYLMTLLKSSVQDLAGRLRDTIHYWVSERLVPALGIVYITGGGSQVRGLPELLADSFSVPVERWSPVSDMVAGGAGEQVSWDYRMTVAFGLALRKFDRS